MNIFLIRHCESLGNVNPKVYFEQRDCDIGLSENGKIQAQNISTELIKEFKKDEICKYSLIDYYVSPYKRALDTFKSFREGVIAHFNNNIYYDVRLREREWGELNIKVYERRHSDEDFLFFNRPLGGESWADCFNRVAQIGFEIKCRGRDAVIVSHAEWIKLFKMWATGQDFRDFELTNRRDHVRNGSITKVVI